MVLAQLPDSWRVIVRIYKSRDIRPLLRPTVASAFYGRTIVTICTSKKWNGHSQDCFRGNAGAGCFARQEPSGTPDSSEKQDFYFREGVF